MQLAPTLIYLSLWASSATAFYPFVPQQWLKELDETVPPVTIKGRSHVVSDTSGSVTLQLKQRTHRPVSSHRQQAATVALRLSRKYDGRNTLTRRKNAYPIVPATTPSTSNAVGIDQDGTDYSYLIEVGLGSNGDKYYMLPDTGAGSSWVMGSDCSDEACKKHNLFGSNSSSSLQISDKDFTVAYGTGKVEGKLATDTLSIAGKSILFKLGLASTTSNDFKNFPFDGILGLSVGNGSTDNLIDVLASSGAIKRKAFGVFLSRASDGDNDGEIKFGGINPAKYSGDVSFNPIKTDTKNWATKLDNIVFDDTKANNGGKLAYIDTGTTYIFGPESLVDELHKPINGAIKRDISHVVPCDLAKPITVTFSGVDYKIPAKDWISPKNAKGECTSNIYGQEVVKDSWLFGATFLKNVYTIFDKDGSRIGFAHAIGDGAESAQSKSSDSSASDALLDEETKTTGGKEEDKDGKKKKNVAVSRLRAHGALWALVAVSMLLTSRATNNFV